MKNIAYVGLDVRKATISASVAEEGRGGAVRFLGTTPNTPTDLNKLARKLSKTVTRLEFCYEAGGSGYDIYRQLTQIGHGCTVIAPSLVLRKPRRYIARHARRETKPQFKRTQLPMNPRSLKSARGLVSSGRLLRSP